MITGIDIQWDRDAAVVLKFDQKLRPIIGPPLDLDALLKGFR